MNKSYTVKEFLNLLLRQIELRGDSWKSAEMVCIPLVNSNLGGTLVTRISEGMDWDNGKLFLHTEHKLCRATTMTKNEIKELAEKEAKWIKEEDGFAHRKQDVYIEAFMDGFRVGSKALIEANEKKDE